MYIPDTILVLPSKHSCQHNENLAIKLFLLTWYIYTFFIQASYDCNLRAYLMQVDKEKPIDTAKDIIDQGRKVYFLSQFDFSAVYEALPGDTFKYEKQYARTTYANGYTYQYPKSGGRPERIQRLMIDEGIVILAAGSHSQRFRSRAVRNQYGYDPFRLSKYPTRLSPIHAGFVMDKNSALKTLFEPVIMRLREADIIEQLSRSA